MAPLPILTAGVQYRIQNIDSTTNLERDLQGKVATLRWRNGTRDKQAQLWTFDEVRPGIFNIRNAAATGDMLEGSISGPPPGFTLTARPPTSGTTQEWKLLDSGLTTFYLLNNTNILLHLDKGNDAEPKLTQDPVILPTTTGRDLYRTNPGRENRWSIMEDSPTELPDGTGEYVIQTLKGVAIQSAASPDGPAMLSFKISHLGEEHKWEIMDLGNGKASIRSTLKNQFIDAQPVGSPPVWTPVLSGATPSLAPRWVIKKLGNTLFSIIFDSPANAVPPPPMPLALTVLNDTIVLRKYMDVQNQQWSIVPTELASFKPLISTSPIDPRYNLPVGEYALRTIPPENGPPFYAWVDPSGFMHASLTDRGSYFKFEFAGGNDGTGLGNVYITHPSGPPVGFLYTSSWGNDLGVYMGETYRKDIWCVQLASDSERYSITNIAQSRRLVSFYPDPNRRDLAEIRLEKPSSNGQDEYLIWELIPKP